MPSSIPASAMSDPARAAAPRGSGFWADTLHRVVRNRAAVAGGTVVVLFSATAMKSTTTVPPATAARFRTTRWSVSAQNPEPRGAAALAGSLIADAGIEEGIRDVRQEIDEHERRGDHQHRALHHRVVAGEDAFDDQPAEAGQGEHRFRQHGPAQVVAELEPE